MTWSSTAPDGTKSVKENQSILGNNTTYIETTMGNDALGTNNAGTRDHFWNVSGDNDGHHRFVKSPAFTVGGVATDPLVGTGMDGVLYLKSDGLTPSRVQGFYRNASNVYQYIPAFLTGTVNIASGAAFTNVVTVPPNCYGEIFMYKNINDKYSAQMGFFKSNATVAQAWAYTFTLDGVGSGSPTQTLKFASEPDATTLNIGARVQGGGGTAGNWNYRITYRAL